MFRVCDHCNICVVKESERTTYGERMWLRCIVYVCRIYIYMLYIYAVRISRIYIRILLSAHTMADQNSLSFTSDFFLLLFRFFFQLFSECNSSMLKFSLSHCIFFHFENYIELSFEFHLIYGDLAKN